MNNLLGVLGPGLLAICGIFEVSSSVKKGYCGASLAYLLAWGVGEIVSFVYVIITNPDIYLLCNYGINTILIIVLLYYKSKPMKPNKVKVLDNFISLKENHE